MLLPKCYGNISIRRLPSARRLYSFEAQSEAQNGDQIQPESAPKVRKSRAEKCSKALLMDLQTAAKERKHHDLLSFLSYAEKIGLDKKSTVYIGTYYEYLTQSSLRRLGFHLHNAGGSNDYGIDLLGTWNLPVKPRPISFKVLVQCKALASRGGPNLIRELEGAFNGAPHNFHGPGLLGLLVTQKPATKGMRDALGRSNWPMGFVTITGKGRVVQMLWNRRAEEEGLEGVGVGIRYVEAKEKDEEQHQEVVLLWKGESIKVDK